jgi:hypothetical protein
MVVDPSADLVQPGGGLLAQRPHQPARPRHLHAGQPARHANTGPTNPAARPQPRAGPSTSRLTAQPSRHPPGPATSTVGGTAPCQVPQVGARDRARPRGWPSAARWQVGSRSSRGAGASLSTGPASPGPPSAAVAAAVAQGACCWASRSRSRLPGDASSRPTSAAGDKAITLKPCRPWQGRVVDPNRGRRTSAYLPQHSQWWRPLPIPRRPAATLWPRLKSGLGCRQRGEPARAARPLRPLCTAVPVVPAPRRRLGKVISTAPTGPGVGDPQQRRYRPQRTKRLPAGRLQ